MARRFNELYIGDEHLNDEGRDLKHIGLISSFGNINVNKISDEPLNLYGLDLETNPDTAELKLLGIWNGGYYEKNYDVNFVGVLFNLIDTLFWKKGNNALSYWNKLDPFVLYKQFLNYYSTDSQFISMNRYGKIDGKWNRKEGKWKVKPVIEVTIKRGHKTFKFGIQNVIRSSVLFFYYEIVGKRPKQFDNETFPINNVWAYDIAPLYKYHLAKEMDERKHLYPYYSKVSKSAHLVDWERYDTDEEYQHDIVDYSNKLDARAVYDLGMLVINDFHKSFGYYPRNLISAGSLARASIVAYLTNKYKDQYDDPKLIAKGVKNDMKSISIINAYDEWYKQIGDMPLKDLMCLFFEAYSGGYIEAIRYGLIGEGYYSDIASAYIKHISELRDLRGSIVTYGEGVPPHIDLSYCFVRGTVSIPIEVDYMPITVKHVTAKETNVRATGKYKASYTLNERDYMLTLGATFKDETWYNIQTGTELSPLANVAIGLTKLRYQQVADNDTAEYLTKTITASLYGISFEATHTFREGELFDIVKSGFRGGELLNPLFASWITAETRIQLSKASNCIEKNGGEPVLLMTDCVYWQGSKNALDSKYIRDKKTLGYFETPQPFTNMASLGTGRYSYINEDDGYITTKNRGLNIFDLHDPEGIKIDSFNWLEALKIAERNNTFTLNVKVRLLVSVGMVVHTKTLKSQDDFGNEIEIPITVADLGRVMTVYRKVDLITGLTKRILNTPLNDIKDISRGSFKTDSIYYAIGMKGDGKLVDQTLPHHRENVMKLEVKTAKRRDLNNRSNASLKYNIIHKETILEIERDKYQFIKRMGFNRDTAKKWCKRSYERIHNELLKT